MKYRWNVLHELIKENNFKTYVEIGVHRGDTCKFLLENIKDEDFRIYAIDPYALYDGYNFKSAEEIKKVAQDGPFKDSRCEHIEKFSADAIIGFADKSIDIIFIDGNHKFGHVNFDIHSWCEKVKDGGILAGHDYWRRNKPVVRAVNLFSEEIGRKPVLDADGVWYFLKDF